MKEMRPKQKRFRKSMTPEQKAAAAERLKLAREAKAAKAKPKYNHIHDSVLALEPKHTFSRENVTKWIKHNKEILRSARAAVRGKTKGAEAEVAKIEGYIKNMETYLRIGVWIDDFYGIEQQSRTKWCCSVLAYHYQGPFKGMVKRSVGVYYPDLGCEWTQEMHKDYYGDTSTTRSSTATGKKRRATRRPK